MREERRDHMIPELAVRVFLNPAQESLKMIHRAVDRMTYDATL
jgi:hypothetical protein